MTTKELREILKAYPEDAVVMFRHNKYGRIDADEIDYKEEHLLSGDVVKTLTLEASFEES